MALGFAGLLPLAGVIVVELMLGRQSALAIYIARSGLGYAALILSFLGGMWWSAACNRLEGAALARWLSVAVMPSLWALVSQPLGLMVSIRYDLGFGWMLAIGLILALIVDRQAVRAGLVPEWWMRLRVPLSCGLAVETLAVAWLV